MFDKYLIVDGSAHNVVENEKVVAFELDARIAYYRGLGLSMVEDVSLTIDGTTYSREATTFTVHGKSYDLDGMERVVDDRWGFNERATVRVATPEPLAPGDHTVTLTERLRISYIPVPSVTSNTKTVTIAA